MYSLPEDHKLQEEPDTSEKRIQQLQREVNEYKRLLPILRVSFRDRSDRMETALSEPAPLFIGDLDRKKKHIRLKHPKIDKNSGTDDTGQSVLVRLTESALTGLLKPTEQQIDKYNGELETYYKAYDQWILNSHEHATLDALKVLISLHVENIGTTTATDIDIKLSFPDGFLLLTEDQSPRKPNEPQPPEKPTGPVSPMRLSFPGVDLLGPLRRVQSLEPRNVSLLDIRKTNSYDVMFRVKKLKHSVTEELSPLVVHFQDRASAKSFNFGYYIHAENMPKVVEGCLHVIVRARVTESMEWNSVGCHWALQ